MCFCREWKVVPGHRQFGVGDLVFQEPGQEHYLVVETKFLHPESGNQARNNRNKGRKKVKEQARFYAEKFKQQHPNARIGVATYTNLDGLRVWKGKNRWKRSHIRCGACNG